MYFGQLDPQSNRADWTETVVLTDEETGDTIDISLCRITMTVRKADRAPGTRPYATTSNVFSVLVGSTDTGEITLVDVGTFQWLFPAARLAGLSQGDYEIGIRISQNDTIAQLMIGGVNIFEGIDIQ